MAFGSFAILDFSFFKGASGHGLAELCVRGASICWELQAFQSCIFFAKAAQSVSHVWQIEQMSMYQRVIQISGHALYRCMRIDTAEIRVQETKFEPGRALWSLWEVQARKSILPVFATWGPQAMLNEPDRCHCQAIVRKASVVSVRRVPCAYIEIT